MQASRAARSAYAAGNSARIVKATNDALQNFKALCERKITNADYPLASSVSRCIPCYELPTHRTKSIVSSLQDEWYRAMDSGPGIIVLQNFFPSDQQSIVDCASAAFDRIIKNENDKPKGDHFATSGANARIWNSFQKHAETDPESFVHYYSNPWMHHICEAWLGPGYQVTAQVNSVGPGGKPQSAHRDYHLGFQTDAACSRFPRSMHIASQYLTLQGAVAHTDMPLNSGPTRLLPFSQLLPEGYMAWRQPEFVEIFNDRWVSLPLKKGDAVFFNPALFHAAGENQTGDFWRVANLVQVSSCFGRTMETINRPKIIRACWDHLKALSLNDKDGERTTACISAVGEAYPFPSNLDNRPPGPGGMAPTSDIELLWTALGEDWTTESVISAMVHLREDSSA